MSNINSNVNTWEIFKTIDLVQFAKDRYNYTIEKNPAESSYSKNDGNLVPIYKNYTNLAMYRAGWDGTKEVKNDIIIIRKTNSAQYFYTNPNSGRDQGTIIDFICNREGLNAKLKPDLATVAKIIKEYSNGNLSTLDLPIYVSPPVVQKDRNAEVARYHKLLSELKYPEYLLARGIEQTTLSQAELKGRIMNTIYRDRLGNTSNNIAFPIVDENDNLCGIENKNVTFSGYQANSEKNIWRSNILNKDIDVDKIIIGEANFDLISYAQIKQLYGQNVLLIGHGGNLTNSQIAIIQKMIDKHKPKEVVLIEDRDNSGLRYDIKLMGALNKPQTSGINNDIDFKAEINMSDKGSANLICTLSFPDQITGENKIKSLTHDFEKFNTEHKAAIFEINKSQIACGQNLATIKVDFKASDIILKKVLEIVSSNRNMGDFIRIDKPIGANLEGNRIKDWNELLMVQKKISKNDIPAIMANLKSKTSKDDQDKVMADNALKPEMLLEYFLKKWEIGLMEPQAEAIGAGIAIEVISYHVAKNQLIAFNNYEISVQKTYALDYTDFKEFNNFKEFVATTSEKYQNVISDKKKEASRIEHEIQIAKAKLQITGDGLDPKIWDEIAATKKNLEDQLRTIQKSYGGYNEALDVRVMHNLVEKLNAKSRKIWDKPLHEFKEGIKMEQEQETQKQKSNQDNEHQEATNAKGVSM